MGLLSPYFELEIIWLFIMIRSLIFYILCAWMVLIFETWYAWSLNLLNAFFHRIHCWSFWEVCFFLFFFSVKNVLLVQEFFVDRFLFGVSTRRKASVEGFWLAWFNINIDSFQGLTLHSWRLQVSSHLQMSPQVGLVVAEMHRYLGSMWPFIWGLSLPSFEGWWNKNGH